MNDGHDAEEQLRFQARLLEAVGHAIVATDRDGRITYWNAAATHTFGWTEGEAVGAFIFDLFPPQRTAGGSQEIQRFVAAGKRWAGVVQVPHRDGSLIPVSGSYDPIVGDDGQTIGVIGSSVDISDLVRAEQQALLRAAQHTAVATVGELAVAASSLDAVLQESCVQCAKALQADVVSLLRLTDDGDLRLVAGVGFPPGTSGTHRVPLGDRSFAGYTLGVDEAVSVEDLAADSRFDPPWLLLDLGVTCGLATVLRTRGRTVGVVSAYRRRPHHFDEDDTNVLRSIANVVGHAIERDEAQRTLARLALTDDLTGLPNRTTLLDRLEHSLRRRSGSHTALLYADLDDFKDINDAMGHDAGDHVLRVVASRLLQVVRDGDTVARLGGDEFAVICEDVVSEDDAAAMAHRMIDTVNSEPVAVQDREVRIDMSVGVVLADVDSTPASLLQAADTAMYVAKAAGGSRVRSFDAEMRASIVHRMNLVGELRAGVANDELEVRYQPQVGLQDGSLWAEALVRWRHPTRGLLPPSAFIDAAEDTGIISEIGRWVLGQAARQLVAWTESDETSLPTSISVNLSARQLVDGDIVNTTGEVLAHTGLDPSTLWLELTETAVLREPERAVATLHELKTLGVGLAIDDFGTGYSSLTYARSLPIDALKIDRSFVSGIGAHLKDDGIVRAVIGLADSFGILSIAEGVETPEQLEQLRTLGCSFAQGYLYMPPGPTAEIEQWCRSWAAGP